MKHLFIILAALTLNISTANAQWQNVLSGLKEKAQSSSALTDIVGVIKSHLVPNDKEIVGTWAYQEPAVMFTSDNALKNAAGSAVSKSVEKKLQTYLAKSGISKGKMSITFNDDKTFTVDKNGRTVGRGTYTVDGDDIALTFKGRTQPCRLTPQLDNGTLVVVTDVTRLKTFLQGIGSNIAQLATVTALLKNVDGIKIGLRLAKQ